jgi:hypothetical protein
MSVLRKNQLVDVIAAHGRSPDENAGYRVTDPVAGALPPDPS